VDNNLKKLRVLLKQLYTRREISCSYPPLFLANLSVSQVNKSDYQSDRILWDPTIRRKSYRNSGDDPRDGSVVLDPIGYDYRKTAYFSRINYVWFYDVRTQYSYRNIESYCKMLIGSNTTDPSVGSSLGFLSDFRRIIRFWEDSDRFCIASHRIRYRIESPGYKR
jgi:hypothetical protein